jgi:hypothetical protein
LFVFVVLMLGGGSSERTVWVVGLEGPLALVPDTEWVETEVTGDAEAGRGLVRLMDGCIGVVRRPPEPVVAVEAREVEL